MIKSTWNMPIAMAVVSTVGLIAALFADGLADVVSWIALSVPVLICGWYGLKA